MQYPVTRMRRLRKNAKIRNIVRETKLEKEDLIYPIYFKEELQGDEKEETSKRLSILNQSNDGFQIAAEDLKLRGPGDFFGSRQSGLPTFRMASLTVDIQTLKDAQEASAYWIDTNGTADTPTAQALRKRIGELFKRAHGTMN